MKPKLILHHSFCPPGAQNPRSIDKEALQRSVAEALPNEQWLVKALVDQFYADIHAHSGGWNLGEHIWHYGKVLVRYRILSDAKQVEILSVTRYDEPAAS